MKFTKTLRSKLIFSYFLLAVIPIFTLSIVASTVYINAVRRMEHTILDYAANQAAENVSVKISSIRTILAQLATNPEMARLFNEFSQDDLTSSESAAIRNRMISIMSPYIIMDKDIVSIAMISNHGDFALADLGRYQVLPVDSRRWNVPSVRSQMLSYGQISNPYHIDIVSLAQTNIASFDTDKHIYFVFPAMDLISRRSYGVLVMEVNTSAINDILIMDEDDDMFFISGNSSLTNQNGNILSALDPALVGGSFSDLNLHNGEKLVQKSLDVRGTSLILNLIFDNQAMRKSMERMRFVLLTSTGVMTIVFVFLIVVITKRLQNRANKITNAISDFRGEPGGAYIELDDHDEILYATAEQFNSMTDEITTLVSELKAKNEHIKLSADRRRRAEIKALQAQINPHFLYNALDRINWLAIDNDEEEISEMLAGLASLLRYSTSNIDILVPLHAEIQWMKRYLFIQGKRFNKDIELICEIEGDAADFPIYKMLIQPLVENSILHGFSQLRDNNKIWVHATITYNACLRLVLTDNGVGMTPDRLDEIRRSMQERKHYLQFAKQGEEASKEYSIEAGIGINNVVDRIWLYYEDEGNIEVKSKENEGTTFILTIPYETTV